MGRSREGDAAGGADGSADAPIGFAPHDHRRCRDSAMAHARAVCAERGLRLTETRAAVLEILLESHAALGAYDILRRLASTRGAAPQPPIAYRALDFLVEHGFAHRVERRNAYVACALPGTDHAAAFMICSDCGAVAEVADAEPDGPLAESAARAGFDIARTVVEAEGVCPDCRSGADPRGHGA